MVCLTSTTGVFIHYFVPKMRELYPWGLFKAPFLRNSEWKRFEATVKSGKVLWFEKIVVFISTLEAGFQFDASNLSLIGCLSPGYFIDRASVWNLFEAKCDISTCNFEWDMDRILFELFCKLESSLEIIITWNCMYKTTPSKFPKFALPMACFVGGTFAQIRPPATKLSRASHPHVVFWQFCLHQNLGVLPTIRICLCSIESWYYLG